jgi:hypothetical protein
VAQVSGRLKGGLGRYTFPGGELRNALELGTGVYIPAGGGFPGVPAHIPHICRADVEMRWSRASLV